MENDLTEMENESFSRSGMIEQLAIDFNISEEKADEFIDSYFNDDSDDDFFGIF